MDTFQKKRGRKTQRRIAIIEVEKAAIFFFNGTFRKIIKKKKTWWKARGVNSNRKGKVRFLGTLLPLGSCSRLPHFPPPALKPDGTFRFTKFGLSAEKPTPRGDAGIPPGVGIALSGSFFGGIFPLSDSHRDCCCHDSGRSQRDSGCWMIWAFLRPFQQNVA